MKIMIVDDEAMIREWINFAIDKLPFADIEVDEADDGQEALAKLSTVEFDLVLIDIQMPIMNGLDLLKKMEDLPYHPMIVMLSSHNQFNYARDALLYHADDYILKSEFSKDRLQEIIEKCRLQKSDIRMKTNISHYRSSFLTNILNNAEIGNAASVDVMFPGINHQRIIVVACNYSQTPADMLVSLSGQLASKPGSEGIFIGCVDEVSYFLFQVGQELDKSAIDYASSYSHSNGVKMACSRVVGNIDSLKDAILSARRTWNRLFYYDALFSADQNDHDPEALQNIITISESIIQSLASNDLDQARDDLTILYHAIDAGEPEEVGQIKDINYRILSALMIHLPVNSNKMLPDLNNLKKRIDKMQHFSDIKALASEYFYFSEPSQKGNSKLVSSYIQEAVLHIHNNYAKIDSIAQIANWVHLNTDYFSRLFKKEVGMPASTYLVDYKLSVAAKLLRTTSETIGDISRQVGYENISYFSKIFKAKYKLKPNQYRKNNKSNLS